MSHLARRVNDSAALTAVPLRSTEVRKMAESEVQPIICIVVVTSSICFGISYTG
ncbi:MULTISPECIES: hypothetical protein [unclassified Streptomyces]|uniref:hypothetical protein n=1 Tax=unclassified Streptomyces TaxID=2593676 RepID=UPI0034473F16